jgi:phosphoribosylformylglycinamidine cyclo-ligase
MQPFINREKLQNAGFYLEGEYDLSGFAVGIVDKDRIIDGAEIKGGEAIVGIASSGLHSNGYSLVRRLFFDLKKMDVSTYIPGIGTTLGRELLKPTKIYVKAFNILKNRIKIKGMAHITGGGIPGNIPRILPEGISAKINTASWSVPKIFSLIERTGNVPEEDMKRTFNMGIGYVLVVSGNSAEEAVSLLHKAGYSSFTIGNTEKGGKGVKYS